MLSYKGLSKERYLHGAVDRLEGVIAEISERFQIIVVGRQVVGEAPGEEDELAVAVHRVVEDDLLLVRRDEVTHVHVLRLDKFIYGIFCSRRRTQNGIYII